MPSPLPARSSINPFDLDGRHALVTGPSSGLGLHFAGLLARQGARVSVCARRADLLAGLCERLAAEGHAAQPVARLGGGAIQDNFALEAAALRDIR